MSLPSSPVTSSWSSSAPQRARAVGSLGDLDLALASGFSSVFSCGIARFIATLFTVALVVGGGLAGDASAVLIATGDGTGNTTAPATDFGFRNVGVLNGLSGVYVRNGWVMTANHVGEGAITLDGVVYLPIPGSTVRLTNPDSTAADLIVFKLAKRPPLPDLAITDAPPAVATAIHVAGYGADRGTATTWMGVDGWWWSASHTLRWGTNRISAVGDYTFDTHAFRISFDDVANPPGYSEADIVTGDSGGGAFTGSGTSTELVGILFARAAYAGQPSGSSLYGNIGLIVDLYAYRDGILAITDRPDCGNGLDDDGDGLADSPADPGCTSTADASERSSGLVCDNELDDDGDGLLDFPVDPGCVAGTDVSERGAVYQCDNGLDDDQDGLIDFPADPSCLAPTNPIEAPEPAALPGLAAGVVALTLLRRRSAREDRSSR